MNRMVDKKKAPQEEGPYQKESIWDCLKAEDDCLQVKLPYVCPGYR